MVAMHPLDALCAGARADPERFWGEVAQDIVPWFRRPDRILVHEPPTFRWFEGGRTNMAWTALDHQVEQGRGEQVALIAADERGGRRRWTYQELLDEVRSIAAALRGLGVGRGDRVTIYMPTTVEAINEAVSAAAAGPLKGVLAYNDEPLVSIDFNHDPASSTYDASLTKVIDGTMVKVISWYDNEWGFSNRMLDTTVALVNAK